MEKHDGLVSQAAAQASDPKKPIPKFASIPTKYNLPEYDIYPKAVSIPSTKEAEFDKYVNAPQSPPGTDLVEFWSVSAIFLRVFHK
jgi:hypothetical protein